MRSRKVSAGKVNLRLGFEKTSKEKLGTGGIGRLYINNEKVGEAESRNTKRSSSVTQPTKVLI